MVMFTLRRRLLLGMLLPMLCWWDCLCTGWRQMTPGERFDLTVGDSSSVGIAALSMHGNERVYNDQSFMRSVVLRPPQRMKAARAAAL